MQIALRTDQNHNDTLLIKIAHASQSNLQQFGAPSQKIFRRQVRVVSISETLRGTEHGARRQGSDHASNFGLGGGRSHLPRAQRSRLPQQDRALGSVRSSAR